MKTKWISKTEFSLLVLAGLLVFGVSATRAQDAPPQPDQNDNGSYSAPDNNAPDGEGMNGPDNGQDPPTRVARLSYADGSVSFQPGGQGDWGNVTRNRPVSVGDKIWSDNNSRAEIQAGEASIHLSSMTALSFLNLDEQTTQMRLAEGTMNFRVRELREGDVYEVDTPNVTFTVTQAGAFHIDVNENGDATRITVIRGEGQVAANGQTYTIHMGESGEFNGTDNVSYLVSAAPEPDDFDRWSNDRDLREDNSISARYVSREVPGYSDLDDNGTWNEEPDYGPVWYPSDVNVGWAPYSYGYWSYIGPWGWTWVGYEPWGFAPYHYGRWAFIGSRWGWCPGPYYARPIYGPAFVGFLGGGFSVGFGFGGGIGWFPLGPHEPFRPWYHTSAIYFRNVNFNNTRFRNSVFLNNRAGSFNYAYAHNVRAVTVSSRSTFVSGQTVNRGAFHVTEASLRGAHVSNRVNVSPTRQSYFGAAGMHGNIARPSAAIQNRPVMARTTPAAAASRMPVRTFNGNVGGSRGAAIGRSAQTGGAANRNRPSFSQAGQPNSGFNAGTSSRQRELSNDKPQSHMRNAPSDSGTSGRANTGNTRNWEAQGNSTDRGRAPAGFGSNTMTRSDRPPSASTGPGNRSNFPANSNSGAGNTRSYSPPQRNFGNSNTANMNGRSPSNNTNVPRGNSLPRSYSPPRYSQPPRTSSAPQRSSPTAGRGSSAPRSAGAPHNSGGGSHGGGSSHGGSPHGRN
ncbi:MAG TPA: DUF6600 domain-containing protein [Candidatus Acidoferrum sp.]|jgi:hypothetical protein